jgi:type VI secretion system protein ImpL
MQAPTFLPRAPGADTAARLLVVGPTGAGKSTLLAGAGFAEATPVAGDPQGVRRLRGPQVEFVEVPGRFLDDAQTAAWRDLLRAIERRSPSSGLDGVVVVVGVDDLLAADLAARRALATAIRARLVALGETLGAVPAVHVIVTQVDRVPGFARFFARLSDSERQQAWGVAFAPEQALAPGAACRDRFAELLRGAERLVTERSFGAADSGDRMALAGFPNAFARLGPPLATFVDAVFAGAGAPPLRSLHFASARLAPAGDPAELARVRRAFDLVPGPRIAVRADADGAPDTVHFVRSLLRDVLPRDRARRATRRGRPGTLVAAGLAGIAALVILVAGTFAFLDRVAALETLEAELRTAERLAAIGTPTAQVAALDTLQARLEALERAAAPSSPTSRWLGGRRDVASSVRAAWTRVAEVALVRPVARELESVLAGDARPRGANAAAASRTDRAATRGGAGAELPPPNFEQRYDALKTYLMLDRAHRAQIEPDWLAAAIVRYWAPSIGGADAATTATRQSTWYVAQLARDDAPRVVARPALVASVRASLVAARDAGTPVERELVRLRAGCEAVRAPLTITDLVGARGAEIVATRRTIGVCHTREGWEQHLRPQLVTLTVGASNADWVLGTPAGEPPTAAALATLRATVERRLREDTRREWLALLRDARLQRPADVEGAARLVARLADVRTSPTIVLVRRAADAMRAAGDATLDRFVQPTTGDDTERLDAHRRHLARMQRALAAADAAGDGGALGLLRTAMAGDGPLATGLAHAEGALVADVAPDVRDVLRPLFTAAFAEVGGVLAQRAAAAIEAQWRSQVFEPWSARLAGRFPFADVEAEAAIADVARFLHPRDGPVAQFRARTLGALVTRGAGGLVPQRFAGVQVRLRPEFLAALATFEGAAFEERLRFDLRPEPSPELSETVLVIDGRTLRYRNEPQEWTSFTWPGAGSEFGASLQAVPLRGAGETVAARTGRWGLVRLLGTATIRPLDRAVWQVTWRTARGANVRYAMRVQGGVRPDRLAALRGLDLPARATQ